MPPARRADPLATLDATVAGFGGETRAGQRELAEAVADALAHGHHLVAEAPTGSGKSLAYLAPAVSSGLKVVVATSTIALQAQLVGKDLPALAEHGSVPFRFALLKGRANYVCRAKLGVAGAPDVLFEEPVAAGFAAHLEELAEFARTSPTGDRSELESPIPAASWSAVSCTSAECPGRLHCADGESCFAEQARTRASEVDVLVVNHALYCADLASHGNVLPEHDVVIIDEAHAFAENATSAFGADLAPEGLTRLPGMLGRAGVDAKITDPLARAFTALAAAVDDRDGRIDVERDELLHGQLQLAAERLAAATGPLLKSEHDSAKRTAQVVAARLDVLRRFAAPGPDDVVWIEHLRRNRRLRIAPVAVGAPIGASLLDVRPMIAVSATLGGEPPFAAFAAQLGLDAGAPLGHWGDDAAPGADDADGPGRADEGPGRAAAGRGYTALQASSTFSWREQGMLYVGKDLPDPGRATEAWVEQAGERVCSLVDASGGRALVLCTSRANVERFAAMLRERTDHVVFAQGDDDVGRLTRAFIEDETSVLVGTRSFWAGIDAPGVSCVLVVIDRIPFPSPGDPLHGARRDRARDGGLDSFGAVDLPAAALVLAQGSGRLLRTREDRGVVAVLDPRLATREYRRVLLQAMPPLRRSIDLAEVREFLEAATR